MKTLKCSLFLTLVLFLSLGASAERLTKKVYKNYPVSKVQKLALNNKYGNIYIENSRTDSVVVSAEIWVEGKSDRARRLLDNINVTVSQNGGTVEAVTSIENSMNGNNEFSIDYHVSVPVEKDLDVVQKYGNVNMKDLSGKGNFEIKYGALNGQKLLCPSLSLDIAYSKVNLDATKDFKLVLHYSKMKLGNGENLKIETRYSSLDVQKCKEIDSDSKYDHYDIGEINSLTMNTMYTGTKIGKLDTKLKLVNGYGGFTVVNIPKSFEIITVENKYAGIKLGIEGGANYRLDGNVRYANIQHPDGKLNKMKEDTRYEVSGTVGNSENPKATVKIESSYGNVSLLP